MEKAHTPWLRRPEVWLAIALVLIIAGSFLAGMFHSSMYSVNISEIEFETERGKLNGLLYMPKGAGADDPRPVIVTTHGYLNTKEMQDAPAIEMSRRGYIVLALDMYDHGDSRWYADIPTGGQFSTFWVYSQFDAANYMAAQPYTLKDENGNAYLAASGHSMGGFSTVVAMYMDEMASLERGTRNIHAGLPVGADFLYAQSIAPMDQLLAAFGSRTVGFIAAHYDEFFFNKSDDEKTDAEKAVSGTVVYKDFAATAVGMRFLGTETAGAAGEAGTYYPVESGDLMIDDTVVRASETGEHVIFTPNETHPWNHFSTASTGSMIGFYQHVFAGVAPASMTNQSLASSSQIWMWKEFFNCVAMIGFFLLIVPLAMLLLRLPFLRGALTMQRPEITPAKTGLQKAAVWLGLAAGTLIPAIFFHAFMDKTGTLTVLGIIAAVIAVCGVVLALMGRSGEGLAGESRRRGGVWVAILSGVLALVLLLAKSIVPLGPVFNEPTVNQVVYWAIISGLLTALITVAVYYFQKRPAGTAFAAYGIARGATPILASLVTALLTVMLGYAVLYIMQAIFGVDFRLWTLAVRTFQIEHVWTALRYMPLFFVYYFANTVAIGANTRGRRAGYLLAICMNILGLALWLGLQYGLLFARGVSMLPTQALNGILLFALVPCLAVAAVFAKKLTERTNNVWLGAFINTILFTMITCANTAMFWNLV